MTRTAQKLSPLGVLWILRSLVGLSCVVWIQGVFGPAVADPAWERDPSFEVRLEAAGQVVAMAAYTNGSVLIGGSFHRVGDAPRSGCALLDADGLLVREFVPDLGESARILSIAVQPDHKILVTGSFSLLPPRHRINIARLNADGSLDETFELPSNVIYYRPVVAVMESGQALFGGNWNSEEIHIFPLMPNGSQDRDFLYESSVSNTGFGSLTLAPDSLGRIYLGGAFWGFRGTGRNYLVRLRGDGTVDPTFATGAGFNSAVLAVAFTEAGRIFAGGNFRFFNGAVRPGVARIDADGTLDLGFKPREIEQALVTSLVSTADGGVLVGGQCWIAGNPNPWGVVRLTRTGSVDRSFSRIPLDPGLERSVAALAVGAAGRIWVGGNRLEETNTLSGPVRCITSESMDDTLRVPSILRHGIATAMKLSASGGMFIAGDFERVSSQSRPGLAHVFHTGLVDDQFVPRDVRLGFPAALEVDRDDQVYAGVHSGSGPSYYEKVRRFRPDGSLDPGYESLRLTSGVRELMFDVSGRLVVSGSSGPDGPGLGALLALGPDGSAVPNAFPGSANLFSTFALLSMPDGSVLCGGNFGYSPSSPGPRYVARLNPDGSLDATFRITNEAGEEQPLESIITSFALDSKGRIVVGGWFRQVGAQSVPGILRLFPDGRLDSSFQPSFMGFNVAQVEVDSEDRIIARGDFFFSETTPNRTVVRVLANGSVDPSFPVISGPVGAVAIQGEAVFVSTGESPFPGDLSGHLIRIAPSQKLPFVTARVDAASGELELRLTPGTDALLRLESSSDLKAWSLVGPAEPVMRISVPSGESGAYYRVVEVR